MTPNSLGRQIEVAIAAAVAFTALSVLVVGLAVGGFGRHRSDQWWTTTSCTAPNLSGAVVDVMLTNMGGPMMGQGAGPMGGMMRLRADQTSVDHGSVSFLAMNGGSVNHELVVLPLPDGQIVGTRPIGGDGRVDEQGSLGEASSSCAEGAGEGIAPGASSWVTMTLPPGRYELVCNLPGHYAAGMYTQLTVN